VLCVLSGFCGEILLFRRKFFDEVHEYLDIQVEVGGEETIAKTRMGWS
jgi:hypothetical protein